MKSLLLLAVLVGCNPSSKTTNQDLSKSELDKVKAAFIYVGPVGDAGWSWAHDQARIAIDNEFDWLETSYLEAVPEGAESERVLSQFAEKGFDVVFSTSFGYMDPTIKVAQQYPETVFMHCSGHKRSDNVGTYFGRMYQAKYLSGIIAARESSSKELGYVAPYPIPEVIRHINAFTLGARSVDPTIKVRVVWTNSWFDPGKEKEAALSLLDAGADVIATGADSAAPMQAAQERNALAIGYDSDGRQFAPEAFLTAPMWDWTVVYRPTIEAVRAKTWKSADFWGGMETGVVKLAPLSDKVKPEVKVEVEAKQAEIASGFDVFAGPFNWQDGQVAYAEGTAPTDQELLSMDRFVEGVVGSIPK